VITAKEIANSLEEVGVLLELQGANPFQVRAYTNAARILSNLQTDLDEFVEKAENGEVKGIGPALKEKISTLYHTGSLPYLKELKSEFPKGLLEILNIPGLGAKKVKVLYEELEVTSIKKLERACKKDELSSLKGFGKKTQENILVGINRYKAYSSRFLFSEAYQAAEKLVESLRKSKYAGAVSVAGSLRRRKEVVKDIDILATSKAAKKLMSVFVEHDEVELVTSHGETKSAVVLKGGIAVDLRVVTEKEYPTALMHFTGSKEHNTVLRGIAIKNGWKLNEYGLFKGEKAFSLKSEEEVYKKLGLAVVPPELREDQGEVEDAAKLFKNKKAFPKLVELNDIKGIIHAHVS